MSMFTGIIALPDKEAKFRKTERGFKYQSLCFYCCWFGSVMHSWDQRPGKKHMKECWCDGKH